MNAAMYKVLSGAIAQMRRLEVVSENLVPCLASSLAVYSRGNGRLRGVYAGAPL